MLVPFNVRDFLDRAEVAYPERLAVVDESDQPASSWGSLTFAELARRARAQAAALDELGVEPGERVAVLSHNCARLLAAFFGVCGWGRILVPVNFRLTAGEVAYIVEHVGASVLLADPDLEDIASSARCARLYTMGKVSDEILYRFDREPRPWDGDEAATATINYTSGTTARPKGVQLTHRNCWVNAVLFGWHVSVAESDVYLHTLPMFHVNGWGMPWALAGMGCPQVVLRKVDGQEILRRVERHGVTLMCAAPAVVSSILEAARQWEGPVPGRGRTRIVVAGAPPPQRMIEQVSAELGWEFIQVYGQTESAPILTVNRGRPEWDGLHVADRAGKLARAGLPLIGTRLRVDAGEVVARSNAVMDGYWQQPNATLEAVSGGWLRTGDSGAIGDDNYLNLLDRKKDVIISGGENVSSIEVEDIIFSHPEVAEVAVIGVPDERWGELVMALVVVAPGSTVTPEELIAHCRQSLAGFKCPKRVELRDHLPRTATGKLQKFKLRAPYWEGRERQIN
jgi:fatty-acyl-CoA synthase